MMFLVPYLLCKAFPTLSGAEKHTTVGHCFLIRHGLCEGLAGGKAL